MRVWCALFVCVSCVTYVAALGTVRSWIETQAVSFLSQQCSLLKNILNVEYEDLGPVDLSSIRFVYRNPSVYVSMVPTLTGSLPLYPSFNSSRRLYVFIHGFGSSTDADSFNVISRNLLNTGEVNVLGLDASGLINMWYLRSTTYIQYIGELLGKMLVQMISNGFPAGEIHLIGHSLGAQIAGAAGRVVLAETGARVGRISGLDPAGPCFSDFGDEWRLVKGNADFVDMIHTNAGIAGIAEAIGDVDIYVNDGTVQPGCGDPSCDHGRSWIYFAESLLSPDSYLAVRCPSWDDFRRGLCRGNDTIYLGVKGSEGSGRFYLQTESQTPYGLGEAGLDYQRPGLFEQIRILK